MVSKSTKRFLDFIMKGSEAGFAGLLNSASKPRLLSGDATKESGVSFIYNLVPYVCKSSGAGSPNYQIPVSTAMAVFDELSTMAFIIEDANKRPGVSIHLEAKICEKGKEITFPAVTNKDNNNSNSVSDEGIDVLVVTKMTKVGKTVGFCDISMLSMDGHTLLAHGSHIKFLPMGVIWDWLLGPTFLPYFIYFLDSVPLHFKAMLAPNFVHEGPPKIEKQSIFDEVNISEEGSFKVKPMLCNPIGALHGGALAIACEEVVTRKAAKRKEAVSVSELEIKYLRSMKGDIRVEISDDKDPDTVTTEGGKCHGVVKNKKNQLCAQFSARLI